MTGGTGIGEFKGTTATAAAGHHAFLLNRADGEEKYSARLCGGGGDSRGAQQ